MPNLMELITQIDLQSKFTSLSELIDKVDPYFVAVIVLFLVLLGSRIVSGQSRLQSLGLRLGAAAFLIYCGWAYYQVGSFDSEQLPRIALKAANAAGIVLAMTWIVLPILAFLYSHIRLALAAFLVYCGYEMYLAGTILLSWEQLGETALRGALATLLVLIVAWIVHPIWDFFKALLPKPKKKPVEEDEEDEEDEERAEDEERPARKEKRKRRFIILKRREAEAALRAEPAPPPVQEPLARPEPAPRPAPVVALSLRDDAQHRREMIRMKTELAYVMVAREVSGRLPREQFEDFVQRYLGDHLPPEEVEANGRHFQEMLHQPSPPPRPTLTELPRPTITEAPRPAINLLALLEQLNGHDAPEPPDVADLEGLARWFYDEQQRVHKLELDQHLKLARLMRLNQQYTALANRLLEGQPAATATQLDL